MRVVALEEHFTVPALVPRYVKPDAIAKRGHYKGRKVAPGKASPMELLPEIGEKRFKSLDDAGITVQVLSNSGPGPDLVPGAGRHLAGARRSNDYLAGIVAKHPKRFAGFASLPMASPDACADELRRAVKDLKFVGAHDPRHHRRPFPRSSELRRPARRGGRARRADLHPSERADAGGAEGLLLRPAGRRRPRASAPPAGAGTRRSRSTSCAWCSPAPSTSIRSSR